VSDGPLENACYCAIGERIRQWRLDRGMTQIDLADKVRLTRTSIVNIEAGRQRPLPHTLYLFAYALRVSVHDLLPAHLNGAVTKMALNDLAGMLNIDMKQHGSELEEIADKLRELSL
jgi:transcriptional regulator with XRE-family HTH domain